jgi:hypothetical protein
VPLLKDDGEEKKVEENVVEDDVEKGKIKWKSFRSRTSPASEEEN